MASPSCPAAPDDGTAGATFIEYAMLLAVIAIVCMAGVAFLGQQASTTFSEAGAGFCGGINC